MKKQYILCIFALTFIFTFSGCKDNEINNKADVAVSAFQSHNSGKINELIFGVEEQIDPEIAEVFKGNKEDSNSILDCIFDKVSISVKSTTDDEVVFEVKAPDMKNVLSDFKNRDNTFSEKEVYNHIKKYADSAKLKKFTAKVPVTRQDDSVSIDYRNSEFINAITGGFLDEYKELYLSVLEQYNDGGKVQ